eukprot:3607660-Pleurochrysis_carterae.AAC.1
MQAALFPFRVVATSEQTHDYHRRVSRCLWTALQFLVQLSASIGYWDLISRDHQASHACIKKAHGQIASQWHVLPIAKSAHVDGTVLSICGVCVSVCEKLYAGTPHSESVAMRWSKYDAALTFRQNMTKLLHFEMVQQSVAPAVRLLRVRTRPLQRSGAVCSSDVCML